MFKQIKYCGKDFLQIHNIFLSLPLSPTFSFSLSPKQTKELAAASKNFCYLSYAFFISYWIHTFKSRLILPMMMMMMCLTHFSECKSVWRRQMWASTHANFPPHSAPTLSPSYLLFFFLLLSAHAFQFPSLIFIFTWKTAKWEKWANLKPCRVVEMSK